MSIPTQQIDGDLLLGRDLTIGGRATVRGSAIVGHNLTVEGWLEAKNIKGPSKGLFKSAVQLRESYPSPHEGWWALVTTEGSSSSDHLGQLYIADGGEWVAQTDAEGNPILKGNPTIDSTEYMQAVEDLTNDINSVKTDVSQNKSDIRSLRSTQTTQGDAINTAKSDLDTAKEAIETLTSLVETHDDNIKTLNDSIGRANGISTLGNDGKVPMSQLPDSLKDVVCFYESYSYSGSRQSYYDKFSTEDGCRVIYDTSCNKFILDSDDGNVYIDWKDAGLFGTSSNEGRVPSISKIYVEETSNSQYRWNGSSLIRFGLSLGTNIGEAYPGQMGDSLRSDVTTLQSDVNSISQRLDTIRYINANALLGINEPKTFDSILSLIEDRNLNGLISFGSLLTFFSPEGWKTYRFLSSDTEKGLQFSDNWEEFGSGTAAVGNCYNVTNEQPISGYYDLESAVSATFESGFAIAGVQITFSIAKGSWKTYQYIGSDNSEANVKNLDNWIDLAGMTAGDETVINVDKLCGVCEYATYYTLEYAIAAIKKLQELKGIIYAKSGLVITYKVGENVWETKQFNGSSSDFGETSLWKDFGGGGSKVETSDAPEEGGKDALSTGGAYEHIPATLAVDTETEGTIKLHMQNAAGDMIGDEVQFAVGTGSGGTGTTIAVAFKENPLYANAGGSFVVKAAIMSVTKAGSQEVSNSITSVSFVNRTTKKVVATFHPKKASSATLTDYSFEFDLSSLCTQSGELPLQAQITDDGGNTATKNISLIAVDVTCVSEQTLNYTKDTSLEVGGRSKSIPLYKFPNNASDKGILVKVEIYKAGEWQVLTTATITDTYSHNVSIDPTGLGHGAYPIRIQGTDVASGTRGNVLHTAVMVIEQREEVADYDKPIVVARWSDDSDGEVKLFETLKIDLACYQRSKNHAVVEVTVANQSTGAIETLSESSMYRNRYYTIEKRIVGYSQGDTLVFDATCDNVSLSEKREVLIDGSLLDIAETEGALYKISLAGRSNTDTDKTIKTTATDGTEKEIVVTGSNYSTNGFVLDTFGTEQSGGRMSLRVAENVKAECTDQPFASTSIPTNGLALSMTFKVKNIAKRNAHIIKCLGERLGFVLTGEKFIVTTNGDSDEALANVHTTAATSYLDDVVYRFDIVIEPQTRAPYSGVMLCKVFQNGDMAACVPIDTSSAFPVFGDTIHFDGSDADLYLYEIVRWNTYYDFIQAFNNYIVNLTNTQAMLTEYEQNQVMADVTAEGVTKPRPDMQKLIDRGVMVCVETRTSDVNLSKDSAAVTDSEIYYPDYIENIKDKKTQVLMDWYLYFPDRPWADCMIEAIPVTNQGTSTLAYAIKNKKGKAKKAKRIVMLHTREEVSKMYNGDETILAKYDEAVKLAAKKKIRIKDGSTPISTITIKVDYSDSAGANNCALMEQMNDVQLALGRNYMTPAQIFNTDSSEELHTSIDGVTCALFRTDYRIGQEKGSEAATLPENAYFHSKANFNADKGNPHFFGFEDVPGYNKGCVNYGDFKEIVTPRGTNIDAYKATVLAGSVSLIPGTLYMISEFCGPETRFIENDGTGAMTETDAVAEFVEVDKTGAEIAADDVSNYDWANVYRSTDGKYYKYTGGVWRDTTGSMAYDSSTGKWVIVGRVLNPVECYEYRQYQEFCWQQGVNSVDDMLETLHTDDGDVPIWSTYYESRYPDDDDLNDLYAQGRKVPYQLFRELLFCQQCNQNLTDDHEENAALNPDGSEKIFNGDGASLTITLDGNTVAGTKSNRLLKWQHEMHHYFNPYSTNHYIVASDYKATVDQRAKNMMIAVYKETDGNMRYYFNHWYDGDSVDEADNDCYLTIPWDMDGANSHLYQGWDGVMFRQSFALFERGEGVWIDDNGTQLTLHDTAAAMRSAKTGAGLEIFSAAGSYRYWMTNRILKWPKVVSSFDGQRKYIETATAADNHYPALHGLRLESLPAFQRKRFAYRDGYYQTGDLFKHFFQARVMGAITVKITAAQDGYFGMGVDSTSSAKYSCYLRAGESHTFTEAAAGVGGKLIYIFGADKLSELDLSGCTPKNSNWVIADCTLLRKLIIGGESYTPSYTDDILSALSLGQMPFLEEIDIRNTTIMSLNASLCPRLRSVLAVGSSLRTLSVAESSPVETLQLPASMTSLQFVNLPKLTYPNGGMTFEGLSNVTRFQLSGCPNIDVMQLLKDSIAGGACIQEIRCDLGNVRGDTTILQKLIDAGAKGIGSELRDKCDGLTGRYILTRMIEQEQYNKYVSYFPELDLHNALYSRYTISDLETDPKNITNEDNRTGYKYGKPYVPSGYIKTIRRYCVPVQGIPNGDGSAITMKLLKATDNTKYHNNTDYDFTDSLGAGYDTFARFCHFWYKGVNDIKVQEKNILLNYGETEPVASWTKKISGTLSELLYKNNVGLSISMVNDGHELTSDMMPTVASTSVYRIEVTDMKQVRYYGMNNAQYGGAFVDAEGKVISKALLAVQGTSNSPLDFTDGDYIFRDVPAGAKWFYFTCLNTIDQTLEAFAVDSDDIEAIEPGWVEHKSELMAMYGMSMDDLMRARSISGKKTRTGTNTQTTSDEWAYDSDGNPTTVPVGAMNYTYQDMLNLCRARGKGYHCISYDQSKILAILSLCWCGNRDDQSVYGFGTSSQYITGDKNKIGKDTIYGQHSGTNKVWNVEGAIACNWEVMDFIGVNISTFKEWKANKRQQTGSVDGIAHIYDPRTDTERTVPYCTSSGYNIARLVIGKYCDVLASKTNTDNSKWVTCYCAANYYIGSAGRCVGRAYNNAHANGGLVCANASDASSCSNTNYGARLAFSGHLTNDAEIDKQIEANLEEYDEETK